MTEGTHWNPREHFDGVKGWKSTHIHARASSISSTASTTMKQYGEQLPSMMVVRCTIVL